MAQQPFKVGSTFAFQFKGFYQTIEAYDWEKKVVESSDDNEDTPPPMYGWFNQQPPKQQTTKTPTKGGLFYVMIDPNTNVRATITGLYGSTEAIVRVERTDVVTGKVLGLFSCVMSKEQLLVS
jgi:hypothetical protein